MTTATVEAPHRMRALTIANERRKAHSTLKRDVREGTLSVVEALEDERACGSLTIAAVLCAQRGWSPRVTSQFLSPLMIPENKPVDGLTERQRELIADALSPSASRRP